METLNVLKGLWHWSVSGAIVAVVMLLMIYYGKEFGLSETYRTLCNYIGADKVGSYFRFNAKEQKWNLAFAFGIVIGSYIAGKFLTSDHLPLECKGSSPLGFCLVDTAKNLPMMPAKIFSLNSLWDFKNLFFIVTGGFMSGFGARYAGGCTSGHFISGLANLQIPSFITLLFFLLGGFLSSVFIIPFFV